MKVAALIPAFREGKHIGGVVRAAREFLSDVFVVDDGSPDDTAARAREAGAVVVVNPGNLGKGASLAAGLDRIFADSFDAAVCLDADGQHIPSEIPRFLEAAGSADLVVGNRMGDAASMPFVRLWTNRAMSILISALAGVHVPDSQCGYRLVRRAAWESVNLLSRNYDFESEMIVAMGRKGFRIASVPVSTVYGDEVSAIHPVGDTLRFARMVWRLFWNR